MTNAMFGWNNLVKAAAQLDASSQVGGLGIDQLRNDQGSTSTAWQTVGAGAQAMRINMQAPVPWRVFGLFRTNLTPGAVVRVRVGNDVNPEYSKTADTGNLTNLVSAGFGQAVVVLPADVVGQFAYVDISDSANPDGFYNIPLVFAGPVWTPQSNIGYDSALGRDDMTDETTARGGAEFPVLQYTRRRWDVSLSGIRSAELWPQAMALDAYARTGGNAVFLPDPAGDVARETIFGRVKSLADITYPYGTTERRAWKVRFTERL